MVEAADARIVRCRVRTGRIISSILCEGRFGAERTAMVDHLGCEIVRHSVESLASALAFTAEYVRECVALYDLVIRQRAERRPTVIDMGVSLFDAQMLAGVRTKSGDYAPGYAETSTRRWRMEVA